MILQEKFKVINTLKSLIVKKLRKVILKFLEPELEKIHQFSEHIRFQNLHQIDGSLKLGENSFIEPSSKVLIPFNTILSLEGGNYIGKHCEISPGATIAIGYGTSIQDRNILLGDVEIGRFCLTAPNVYMSSGTHLYSYIPEYYIKDQDKLYDNSELLKSKKIIIEDDVWIGINCVVLPGVRIGKGSVIGSNSVINNDIPPYSIAVGSPARVVKQRLDFNPLDYINYKFKNHYPYFYNGFMMDIEHLNKSIELGGIYSTSFFVLKSKFQIKKIEIMMKSVLQEHVCIENSGIKQMVDNSEFRKYVFYVANNLTYNFKILEINESYKPILLIKEIRLLEV